MSNTLFGNSGRRSFLKSAGAAGLAVGGTMIGITKSAHASGFEINMQLGWLASNGQLGEVAADALGYYKAEGLTLKISPGGPSVDGVALRKEHRTTYGKHEVRTATRCEEEQDLPKPLRANGFTGAKRHI